MLVPLLVPPSVRSFVSLLYARSFVCLRSVSPRLFGRPVRLRWLSFARRSVSVRRGLSGPRRLFVCLFPRQPRRAAPEASRACALQESLKSLAVYTLWKLSQTSNGLRAVAAALSPDLSEVRGGAVPVQMWRG